MNQSTTTNKLNNTKVNTTKVNNSKVNDSKVNTNTKTNDTKSITNTKGNDSKVNNNKTTPAPTGYSGKNIAGMGLLVVVLIIVLGSSYWLYNYYSKKSFITVMDVDAMPDVKVASSSFNIASNLIPNSTYSNEYSISCWVNILDYNYNYGKEKVILRRGDKGSANPEIILAPKTNDLFVRVKLQGAKPTSESEEEEESFMDIPITMPTLNTINLDSYEETVSEGKLMYDESQIQTDLKEKFNISSYPAPVKFESNSSNNNKSLDIDTSELGENKVDYPTIKYISNHNNNFDEQYFTMISGNDINSSDSSNSCNSNPEFSRGGNHSMSESFNDIDDAAKKVVDNVFSDIEAILGVLSPSTLPVSEQYSITSTVYSYIIELLNKMSSTIKANGTNFDTLTGPFKTTMKSTSTNPQIGPSIDKLVADITGLVTYNSRTFDYSTLITKINTNPLTRASNMPQINASLVNPTNSLIDNLIILLQQLLVITLQAKININARSTGSGTGAGTGTATTVPNCVARPDDSSDPTVGSCGIKMLPLQKWVNIIVSVYNQVVDIYIDGLLTSSCVLKTFPAISTADVSLTPDGGFSGYISRVKFLNSAMTVQKAKDIYYDGPIYSPTLFSQIPNWVYYTLLVVIIAAIGYSYFM